MVPDPPKPQPLLFVPVQMSGTVHRALVDYGSSDSFLSEYLATTLRFKSFPLRQSFSVKVANVHTMPVIRFAKLKMDIGNMPVRLSIRILATPNALVLGYPFHSKFQPIVDWKNRVLYDKRKAEKFVIPSFPAVEWYRVDDNGNTHKLNLNQLQEDPKDKLTTVTSTMDVSSSTSSSGGDCSSGQSGSVIRFVQPSGSTYLIRFLSKPLFRTPRQWNPLIKIE